MDKLNAMSRGLFTRQLTEWELARNNYEALRRVEIREFAFDGFSVKVQFNPARIVSSGAKTDAATIASRPCFLCGANRPTEQEKIEWGDYEILVNPFPIFPFHLTVPRKKHVPQEIEPYITDMFSLAKELSGCVVFYNGAQCGASAPDHFHFQVGNDDFLPLIDDYFRLKGDRVVIYDRTERAVTFCMKDYLRTVLCIESMDADALHVAFLKLYNQFVTEPSVEPMLNLVCTYREGRWYLFVIPRGKFRPWQYSAESGSRLLVSPATVEMAGIFITPVREHFERITREDIIDIYTQVTLNI